MHENQVSLHICIIYNYTRNMFTLRYTCEYTCIHIVLYICIIHKHHIQASYACINLFSSVDSQLLIHCRLKVVLNNAAAVDDDHFCKGNTHTVTVMLTLQEVYTAAMPAVCR